MLAALVLALAIYVGPRLGAQPVSPPAPDPDRLPTGFVAVTLSTSPEVLRMRDVSVRNVGGRAFLVGAPGERQLTATTPLVWAPVDLVVQMTETTPP
jgi:hypothetical protein